MRFISTKVVGGKRIEACADFDTSLLSKVKREDDLFTARYATSGVGNPEIYHLKPSTLHSLSALQITTHT